MFSAHNACENLASSTMKYDFYESNPLTFMAILSFKSPHAFAHVILAPTERIIAGAIFVIPAEFF